MIQLLFFHFSLRSNPMANLAANLTSNLTHGAFLDPEERGGGVAASQDPTTGLFVLLDPNPLPSPPWLDHCSKCPILLQPSKIVSGSMSAFL